MATYKEMSDLIDRFPEDAGIVVNVQWGDLPKNLDEYRNNQRFHQDLLAYLRKWGEDV